MALSRQQSLIWQAMNVGAQWVLRDGADPLAPEEKPIAKSVPQPETVSKPAAAAPTNTVSTTVRRGPMATRLRRQQAAAGVQVPRASSTPSVAADEKTVASPSRNAAQASLKPQTSIVRSGSASRVNSQDSSSQVHADPQVVADLQSARWQDIKAIADRCKVCSMAKGRTNTVVADGEPGCPIVMIGEAPGREEDLSGVPFVGNSGKLLTEILKACNLHRGKDVAICNVLKCRPPGNRDPRPDEVSACSAFLDRQLELLQPKLLILMGKHAVARILGETRPISQMRGKLFEAVIAGRKVPVVVTYHPSYLLRNPVAKELGWHDILFAKKNVP